MVGVVLLERLVDGPLVLHLRVHGVDHGVVLGLVQRLVVVVVRLLELARRVLDDLQPAHCVVRCVMCCTGKDMS